MGLDIIALQGATYVNPQPDEDYADENYERFTRVWVNSDFPERAEGLRDGFYTADDSFHFRAGGYGGYNRWREWLSEAALGVEPAVVWANPEQFAPFVELIHFADNEGIIGPATSAKLAADFAEYEDRILAVKDPEGGEADEWNANKYREWRKAFEMASEGGLVQFC